MCRFVLYLGPPISLSSLVSEPTNSIIHQSFHSHEREEPLNGDGFGVAWYLPAVSPEPAVFRSITPAWSNVNLLSLGRVTRSACLLAHVRAASPGLPVTETNTHPFTHGRLAFMHNGELAGFGRVKRALLASLADEAFDMIQGNTDSEYLFALVVDELRSAREGGGAGALADALSRAMERALSLVREAGIREVSNLNLALADGSGAVVSRFTTGHPEGAASLYLHTGSRYVCEAGQCRMIRDEGGPGTVLVSSEPLSADPGWSRVPPNHLVVIGEDRRAELRPVSPAPGA